MGISGEGCYYLNWFTALSCSENFWLRCVTKSNSKQIIMLLQEYSINKSFEHGLQGKV